MNKKTLQELISNCHAAGKKTAVSFAPMFRRKFWRQRGSAACGFLMWRE